MKTDNEIVNDELNYKYRATGRTTRLIDKLVQDYFTLYKNGDKIYVKDHDNNEIGQHILCERFKHRMLNEHSIKIDFQKDKFGTYIIK